MRIPGGITPIATPGTLSLPAQFWFAPAGINGGTLVNGADVTAWTDWGPNGYVPTAIGGAGARLTVVTGALNGYPAANGSGTKHGLSVPDTSGFTLSASNTYTIFAVASWTGNQAANSFFGIGYNNVFPWGIGLDGTTNQLWNFFTAGNGKASFVPTFGTYYGIIIENNAGTVTGFVNGASYSMPISGGTPTYPSGQIGFTLGDYSNTRFPYNNFLYGNLVDIALYNGALTNSDLLNLRAYCQITYGLP
jgi:hypothetical protein